MDCPLCDQSFEDGRGLHGHLRFKEGLSGDELEEVFRQAKDQSVESNGDFDDPKMQAVEDLRVAKNRLQEAKDRKEALKDSSGGGMTKPLMTTWQEVKGELKKRIDGEISRREEEAQKCIDRLDEEIQREVDRRE